jgi:ABC-type transport system involved in multi-copper enzyme maturation permease subunit
VNPRCVGAVAWDLLREARARRWVLALFGGITLLLLLTLFGLRLEVVDGALAASRLFGGLLGGRIQAVDVALRPLFTGVAYVVFYAGIAFGVLACADFAPALLAPGRIEHLLSLPLRRAELVAGTFLGVLCLVLCGALYGGLGMTLLVWAKTGVFGWAPVLAAVLAAAGFAAVYAVMIAGAVAVRSAALSAAAGGVMLVLGILAGNRRTLAPLFSPGASRRVFLALTAPLPRLSELADHAGRLAGGHGLDLAGLAVQLGGTALFSLAVVSLAIALFERKDF